MLPLQRPLLERFLAGTRWFDVRRLGPRTARGVCRPQDLVPGRRVEFRAQADRELGLPPLQAVARVLEVSSPQSSLFSLLGSPQRREARTPGTASAAEAVQRALAFALALA